MGPVANGSSLQGGGSGHFPGVVWVDFGPSTPCFGGCGGFGWFPCVFLCILVGLTAPGVPSGVSFEGKMITKFDKFSTKTNQNEPKSTKINQNHVLVDFGAFWCVLVGFGGYFSAPVRS